MLAFPARIPRLDDSLVAFPALAIAVGEGQMLTVSAVNLGLGPVDRLSALPAEVGRAFVGVVEPFTAPAASPSAAVYISSGSPSLILRFFLISLGTTILPSSSIRLTIPVAFI